MVTETKTGRLQLEVYSPDAIPGSFSLQGLTPCEIHDIAGPHLEKVRDGLVRCLQETALKNYGGKMNLVFVRIDMTGEVPCGVDQEACERYDREMADDRMRGLRGRFE